MTQWILERSVGFTDVGLLRISESVRAYAYLILSSQASARSGIVGNTVSALTGARSKFWGGGRVRGLRLYHPPYHPP